MACPFSRAPRPLPSVPTGPFWPACDTASSRGRWGWWPACCALCPMPGSTACWWAALASTVSHRRAEPEPSDDWPQGAGPQGGAVSGQPKEKGSLGSLLPAWLNAQVRAVQNRSVAVAAAVAAATTTTAVAATATAVAATRASAVGAAEAAFAATATAAATAEAATAAAAATTVAATTTAAAEAATATRGTRFHRAGFVDHHAAATEGLTIHAVDGGLCFGVARHFHKAETLRAAGVTLHHDFGAGHSTKLAKSLFQVVVAHRVRQVADVQFVAHQGTPQKHINKAMESRKRTLRTRT